MTPEPTPAAPRPRSNKGLGLRLAILVVVLGGLLAYYQFWAARPSGSGPAGPPVPREAFAKVWSTRPVLLLGLGDSITEGFGASQGKGYFDRLVTNPPDEFPDLQGITLKAVLPNLRDDNRSTSGSTSLEHTRDQIPSIPRADPGTLGLVVITTGGNDIVHNYGRTPPREGAMYGATMAQARPWIAAFEKRLETMIGQIEALFPGGCHIFLGNIYDPTCEVGDIQNAGLPAWKDGLAIHSAYNDVIARAAEKHENVHLVDIRRAFYGHGIHCSKFWMKHYDAQDPHYWYYANLEDPNDRGYDAIRRLFLLEISKVISVPGGGATSPTPPGAASGNSSGNR
ncbi:MAG TPA: SGNH/GDSL hydrolase family protein [Armatimonadota bacterium]|nr:SGNH/GDSL hydrolase family protein [Armatimonadota bacterium]